MQSSYPEQFDREMGCTEREWLSWLPGAVHVNALTLGDSVACVVIDTGKLHLRWQALAPRQIALVRLPRLRVEFRFAGLDAASRLRFMRYFDLYMHRGGG